MFLEDTTTPGEEAVPNDVKEQVIKLIRTIKYSPDTQRRQDAAEKLGLLGIAAHSAVNELCELLDKSKTREDQLFAAYALKQLGVHASDARQSLIKGLEGVLKIQGH